jgi:hypothetical protein
MPRNTRLWRTVVAAGTVGLLLLTGLAVAQERAPQMSPLVRVVDLSIGGAQGVTLADGSTADVRLLDVRETRDSIRRAIRRAEVDVEVNGETATLVAATYHLPVTVGNVQIDCAVTRGYNSNGRPESWGLEQDARLRLWPANSPWIRPDTFRYPARQRWFASDTQMANEPTFVDAGEDPDRTTNIYYHSGLDIGGAEGEVEIIAATDGLVVSAGMLVLEEHRVDTPVAPRYDVVYILDARGWYYRYSHLQEIDERIKPGRVISMGDRIGVLGKEGGSGGWSHLHFEIKARQPSGRWGTQAGYAFLWQSYVREHQPKLIAVARPHHLAATGETVTLDGSRSWSASRRIDRYEWTLHDGPTAQGPQVQQTYDKPGRYSEILKVTDNSGNVAYDFAVVVVVDRAEPESVPTIHPVYAPTTGIKPGQAVTFKVRTFDTIDGRETWDFGDGSPPVTVQSDGNVKVHNPEGYAVTEHRFESPGDYIVTVSREDRRGRSAVGHLHVHVENRSPLTGGRGEEN